ncbi:MAG: adenylate kinase [Actinomycetota bacterium]|nr:adenylate kinase [Actinomycetota bacterium]
MSGSPPAATRLLLMGPPGSGKGTQAVLLARILGVPAISTGQLFRAEVREETDLGRQVSQVLADGGYVPDELTNELVAHRLDKPDAERGFLLDGYPRTTAQVHELDAVLARRGHRLDAALVLVVDSELLIARLEDRAAMGRTDDRPEVVRERIARYETETAHLSGLYEERGILHRVDGTGHPDEVTSRLAQGLRIPG